MKEIIQKTAEIYFRYGIKSVTMDDLAGELGISKKTLYQHFKDKEHVVEEVVQYLISIQEEGIRDALTQPNTTAIDKLMLMSLFFARFLKNSNPVLSYDLQKYYPAIWEKVETFKREAIFTHIFENLQQGIQEELYREDLNAEIIAKVFISRMEMHQTALWRPLEKFSLEEVFQTIFIYHIRGTGTLKGIAYLEKNMNRWQFNRLNDPKQAFTYS
jgi:TetR/AcrR family transcriptional regulator, cholesterol catabolism regulator